MGWKEGGVWGDGGGKWKRIVERKTRVSGKGRNEGKGKGKGVEVTEEKREGKRRQRRDRGEQRSH